MDVDQDLDREKHSRFDGGDLRDRVSRNHAKMRLLFLPECLANQGTALLQQDLRNVHAPITACLEIIDGVNAHTQRSATIVDTRIGSF
jgi:hypothetical protein